ncbi:MAG: ATP-binding cassette domain-containing protein, partial [Leptotrichiaceae bacterium]
MSVVQFNNIYKQFSGEYLLKDISFTIEDKDRIGLVGLNGTGKSTLIKMLLGMERIDPDLQNNIGNISMSNTTKVGYLSQNHNFSDEMNSVYEEMLEVFIEEHKLWHEIQKINSFLAISEGEELEKNLELLSDLTIKYESKNGYEIEYRIRQILTGLELEGYQEQIIKDLSGGEKTRVALAKLLLQEPDLLVLDEPTNHLDLVSIEWLEEYLKKYGKAFLLVSHDRIFLDNVCNKIYEVENKKLYKYEGNFSRFILQKELILKGELKRYEKEQEKVKKMEEY